MTGAAPEKRPKSLVRLRGWLSANTWTPGWQPSGVRHPLFGYVAALLAVAIAAALTYALERALSGFSYHGMLGFFAVLCTAIIWGRAPALLGAAANTVLLNFLVRQPMLASTSGGTSHAASSVLGSAMSLAFGVAISLVASQGEVRRRLLEREHSALGAIFDLVPNALTVWDREGRLVRASAQVQQSGNVRLGARLADLLAAVRPETEDGAVLGADDHPVGKALRGEQVPPVEVSIVEAGGRKRYLMLQVAAVRELTGAPTGAVLIAHDNTVAKEAQVEQECVLASERRARIATTNERDHLQQILDVLPDGVIIYDAGTRVTSMNRVAETLLGVSLLGRKRAEFDAGVRRPDGTLVPWNDIPSVRTLESGESSRSVQLLIRNISTGEDVPILTSSVALRSPDGSMAGAVTAFQDIAPIKNLEQQRDRMLATVTHDLRNPLTSISGMSQILQMRIGYVDEPARERFANSLKTIENAAQRMMAQIGELLDFALAQSGRSMDLGIEPTNVVALVRQIMDEHQRSTEKHTLELHAAEETIVTMVDPHRLERAITNLLVNAIKYSPQGGPIVVSIERAIGPDGRWVNIAVADNGVGVPNDDLPHLFEQYYRASNVAATIPGTGIGLANVRHLVERHGGTVTVDSTERAGTTVTVRLPLVQPDDAQSGAVSQIRNE